MSVVKVNGHAWPSAAVDNVNGQNGGLPGDLPSKSLADGDDVRAVGWFVGTWNRTSMCHIAYRKSDIVHDSNPLRNWVDTGRIGSWLYL